MKLRTLAGLEPPPALADDLRRLLALPAEAKGRIWKVLGASLADPITREVEAELDAFCAAHALSIDDLGRAVKACRFLLREAARMNVARDAFAADLEALVPGAPELGQILLAGFDQAIAHVRLEHLEGAMLDHGRVLVGIDWRVDNIEAAGQSPAIRTPIALLTLRYKTGKKEKKLTLQLSPSMVHELKRICDGLAG